MKKGYLKVIEDTIIREDRRTEHLSKYVNYLSVRKDTKSQVMSNVYYLCEVDKNLIYIRGMKILKNIYITFILNITCGSLKSMSMQIVSKKIETPLKIKLDYYHHRQ